MQTLVGPRRCLLYAIYAHALRHPDPDGGYARGVSTADVVVVVAAAVGSVGAVVSLVAAFVLVNQVRRLERGIEALRHEAVPLVEEAHAAAGHAATEIARVDAVLADTEAVTAAVDHAAHLARRAFANPVVKVLAWRAGAIGGLRRLREDRARPRRPAAGRHRRQEHIDAEPRSLPAGRRSPAAPHR
jgi:hypothetical protein